MHFTARVTFYCASYELLYDYELHFRCALQFILRVTSYILFRELHFISRITFYFASYLLFHELPFISRVIFNQQVTFVSRVAFSSRVTFNPRVTFSFASFIFIRALPFYFASYHLFHELLLISRSKVGKLSQQAALLGSLSSHCFLLF